jgi:hypothetical protein
VLLSSCVRTGSLGWLEPEMGSNAMCSVRRKGFSAIVADSAGGVKFGHGRIRAPRGEV